MLGKNGCVYCNLTRKADTTFPYDTQMFLPGNGAYRMNLANSDSTR